MASILGGSSPLPAQQLNPQPVQKPAKNPTTKTLSAELGQANDPGDDAESVAVDTQLGLTLSAQTPQTWKFRIAIAEASPGTFSQLDDHNQTQRDDNRLTIATDGRSIEFDNRQRITQGDLRFRFTGESKSRIVMQFISQNNTTENDPDKNSTTLEPLIRGGEFTVVGDPSRGSPMLALRRLPGDEIAIRFDDESIYRQSGEPFRLLTRANAASRLRGKKAALRYQLYRVADAELVDEQEHPISIDNHGDSVDVLVQGSAPKRSGAYEIRCRISDTSAPIWSRLRRDVQPILETRSILIVSQSVADDTAIAATPSSSSSWTSLGEIRPANQPGWELRPWLSGKRLSRSAGGKSNSGSGLSQAQHDGRAVSLLEPKSTYSTRLPKLAPGTAHRLTLRYPAGQTLRLQVDLAETDRFDRLTKTYQISDTPARQQNHRWQTQSLLVFPTASDSYVRLTNLDEHDEVAFESINLDVKQSVREDQPALPAGPSNRTALLNLRNHEWMDRFVTQSDLNMPAEFASASVAAHRAVVAVDRLIEYLTVNGYNAVVIPGIGLQDSLAVVRRNTPATRNNAAHQQSIQTILRRMNGSGIGVYLGYDLADPSSPKTQQESGAYRLIDAEQFSLYKNKLSVLDQQWIQQKSYRGIVIQAEPLGQSAVLSDLNLLSESVLRRFANELDPSDPSAPPHDADLTQLRSWVIGQAPEKFQHWCETQSVRALDRIASELRGQLILLGKLGDPSIHHPRLITARELDHRMVSDSLPSSADGTPRDAVQHHGSQLVAVVIEPKGLPPQYRSSPSHDRLAVHDLAKAISAFDPQIVIVNEDQISMRLEDTYGKVLRTFTDLPLSSWTRIQGVDPETTTVQVQHTHAGGQSNLIVTNLAPWQTDITLQLAASLPWQVRSDLTDPTTDSTKDAVGDISLRQGGGQLQLSLPPGTLTLLGAANPNSVNAIRTWTSQVSGGEESISEIQRRVTEVVERIGRLANPQTSIVVRNGGFEQAGPFDRAAPSEQPGQLTIPGWMHTQHPADSVRIDATEAIEGRQSIVLKTASVNAGRTWIVSEQFAPPKSGRLAVSLSCRGELVPNDQTKQQLQISIEGTRSGEPIRFSETIEIDRDGQWQPRRVVLEANNITSQTVDSIRLTIDSLSRGRVWIDDIQTHDWFPLAHERRQLQDQAFMAVQGLQRGRLAPASNLLQNSWAQSLLAPHSLTGGDYPNSSRMMRDQAIADASNPASPTRPGSKNNAATDSSRMPRLRRAASAIKPPSVAERIKGWLPRPLRF